MRKLIAVVSFAAILAPAAASAHSAGALDPHGCHYDRRDRQDYHCHRGRFNGVRFKSKATMLEKKKEGLDADDLKPAEEAKSRSWNPADWFEGDNEEEKRAAAVGNDGPAPTSVAKAPAATPMVSQGSAAPAGAIVPRGVEQRLRTLKHLHGQGLISDEEYAQKKGEILGDL